MTRGFFVGGTGTGVGKTVFSTMLIAWLRARGLRVAPMKPSETGCAPEPLDALTLLKAAGGGFPLAEVCPYPFALPAAPQAAAAREGARIRIGVLRGALAALARRADIVVAEGAGHVATPYGPRLTGIEVARGLGLPVILVTTTLLGAVGQTVAAARAMRAAGVRCAGVCVVRAHGGPPGPHEDTAGELIREHAPRAPLLGTLPWIAPAARVREEDRPALLPAIARARLRIFDSALGPALAAIL